MTTYSNIQRYFRFNILNINQSATGENAGFIDPLKPQDYVDFDSHAGTLKQYEAKARGYLRWLNLSLALSKFGINYLKVDEIEGADSLTEPTSLIFTVGYDNAEYMYYKNSEGIEYTSTDESHLVPTDEDPRAYVLKKIAADVLVNNYTGIIDVWNPEADDQGRNPSGAPIGTITPQLKANKIINSVDQADACINIKPVEYPFYDGES